MPSPAPGFDFAALPWLSAAFLGVGLAASSGLRTFLPLLLLSGAAKFGFFGIYLSGSFEWLASPTAFSALLLATIVEIGADKIPVIDHALDSFGTILRPGAGALAAAAVWNQSDPATAALLGLIFGAPLALGFHAAKSGTRAGSTVTTAGLGNPVLSVVEDIAALFLGLVSLFLPLLVPLLLIVALLLMWRVYRLARRIGGAQAKTSVAKSP
ncbi:MAG TPA: DUF4126 domain-containing protein [Abditibacterium sp.]|jgi:hypothetical protein